MSNDPYANAVQELISDTVSGHDALDYSSLVFKPPKPIAKITLCGFIHFTITDDIQSFIKPTPEQIKNLKEMLCIDIELLEEEEDA